MNRAVELLLLLLVAPVALPVAAVTALFVLVAEGRPVFFHQDRAGFRGRPFRLVKFRSMRTGEGSDESRLTRFGRFLRASSLDEVPELWNVLRGEMALVGPRPLPLSYLPRYTAEQNRRHEVRPGITGWAQVHGRNLLDWESKFRYDVEYVERRSFLLDAKIIAMTVGQVLFARGISAANEATMDEFKGTAGEGARR